MMDDQISDSSDEYSPNDNKETLIVNGLFGIADEENNVENTTASPEFSNDINMEAEVVDTIMDKLCNENDLHIIKTTDKKNCDDTNGDSVQKAESNCFGSHMLCSKSTDLDHTELSPSFATISKNYEKSKECDASKNSVTTQENSKKCDILPESDSKAVVVLSKDNLPSTLSLISTNYQDSSSDDSDTSDDDNSNDNDQLIDSDNENSIISVSSNTFLKDNYVKTKGELDISDLPPIEDLKISVDEAKCQPVGCIKSVVDTLVIVEAFLNQPALDIDSVLFVDRGKRALGRIFDVFGSVTKPFYAVRFNDSNHIKTFDIQIKEPVYCAPQTEYASYVMVSQLMQMKGSDASWRDNNEPPCEFLDYSDDEAEKLAKKNRRQKKCTQPSGEDNKDKSPDPPSRKVLRNNPTPRSITPRPSFQNSNNRTQQTYNPCPPNYSYGPRQFPTYAQQLSSMEFSQAYRQPYNPWYYDPTYAPRHDYPHRPPYMPPVYDYRSQPPMDPNNPNNRFYYPDRYN
ncbi:H/ACA ribonucleoprotein complex non-core subunit NAF1 [Aphis gossypii]|uniref:H/ACA ribonucleoprotein complex non-core subunit NAF1 n=1 Tax=Aphis gossypii TaxID=80765 RepID=UPI0021592940|nr:H/ACA ribonucleoprotein complex non-core subunit NAF1 [Aphis gossypii]